jgi:hypothetical protein
MLKGEKAAKPPSPPNYTEFVIPMRSEESVIGRFTSENKMAITIHYTPFPFFPLFSIVFNSIVNLLRKSCPIPIYIGKPLYMFPKGKERSSRTQLR